MPTVIIDPGHGTTEIALPFGSQDEEGKQPEEAVQKYRDVLKSAIFSVEQGELFGFLGVNGR